jgi:hypothetical protein
MNWSQVTDWRTFEAYAPSLQRALGSDSGPGAASWLVMPSPGSSILSEDLSVMRNGRRTYRCSPPNGGDCEVHLASPNGACQERQPCADHLMIIWRDEQTSTYPPTSPCAKRSPATAHQRAVSRATPQTSGCYYRVHHCWAAAASRPLRSQPLAAAPTHERYPSRHSFKRQPTVGMRIAAGRVATDLVGKPVCAARRGTDWRTARCTPRESRRRPRMLCACSRRCLADWVFTGGLTVDFRRRQYVACSRCETMHEEPPFGGLTARESSSCARGPRTAATIPRGYPPLAASL